MSRERLWLSSKAPTGGYFFAIPLKSNAKIQFKRIGFQNKTIDLENNTSQVFILSSDNVQLKEVNAVFNYDFNWPRTALPSPLKLQ